MTRLKRTILLFILSLLIAYSPPFSFISPVRNANSAEFREAPEQLIKAAYLYKFLFFVKWPETDPTAVQTSDEFVIGILGNDPFGDNFKEIEGRVVGSMNRKITIRRLGRFKEGLPLKECQILYIASSERKEISNILNIVRGAPILTVADSRGFLEEGIIVNMVNVGGRVRWELNLKAAKASNLSVSSSLIQSAVKVLPVR